MSDTLDNIQSDIAAILDSDSNTANISSTDYTLRTAYINIALGEYETAYDWQHLHKQYNLLISAATGNASVVLPQDFRKASANPIIAGTEFQITRPQDGRKYFETDQRVELLGNPQTGRVLRIYGITLVSGASIQLPYYASAGSLATVSDITTIPDSSFISRRAMALWYEAHEDARFLATKLEAERILANLIDYENVFAEGSQESRVRSVDEDMRFRMGED